jgi:hypothetical protein
MVLVLLGQERQELEVRILVAAGGGGGQGSTTDSAGGNGGSGIVLLRFTGTYTAAATTGSPVRTVNGGYTYYHWTGTGSITI